MRRALILAAGQGKRMKSALPKVLHTVCGRSMLWHVVQALRQAAVEDIVVVASPEVAASLASQEYGSLQVVVQENPLGTGHAVQVALAGLPVQQDGQILIVSGDMPLVQAALLNEVFAQLDEHTVMSLASVQQDVSSHFGRIVRAADGSLEGIVEHRDATPDQAAITEMNAGYYAFHEGTLRQIITALRPENAQQEYYLTDTVALVRAAAQRIAVVEIRDREHALGVNDRVELARAHQALNARLCAEYMRAGVTIIDPSTTYLEPELAIGRDTVLYPNTMISRLSEIGEGCVIGPNVRLSNAKIGARTTVRESVILDSTVGADCEIGPFAHLRMETILGDDVRLGNFVEVKHSRLGRRVRAGHLSYLGDAEIEEMVNIGAGTVTCNYDGQKKHRTLIKKAAFIGSNTSLIAPVTIGAGALTGAGSVVTRDVADHVRVVGNPAKPLPARTGEPAWR